MKNIKKLSILAFVLCCFVTSTSIWAADDKITNFTEDTSPTSDDLVTTINDPSGTPANRKVSLTNLPKAFTDVTWGTSADTSHLWTWDTGSGTDPTMTVTDDDFTFNKTVKAAGFEATGTDHYLNVGNSSDYSTTTDGDLWYNTTSHLWKFYNGSGNVELVDASSTQTVTNKTLDAGNNTFNSFPVEFGVAVSDETTDLTTGTAKVTFRMPHAMTLTEVRANVNTAPVGSTITVDINESGTTILSTKLTIDASEETSTTAATPAVISDSSLADDAEITVDIDQIGSTTAGKGLKIWLIGTRDF